MPIKKNGNIQDQELFTLFIETLTGTTFEIKVSPQDRVRSIKCKIQRVEGIPIAHQHLLYNLKELKDSSCVTDPSVALHDQATVKLVLSMRGGPISLVHQTIPFSRSTLRSLIKINRRDDAADESSPNCKMAVLVLRVGDQLNLLHVLEDFDGPEPRESWSRGNDSASFDNLLEGETCKSLEENSRTMEKVCDLREKMEKLALQRKSHKSDGKTVNNEIDSDLISRKPSCSIRLPSIHRDVKDEMFKSRSEFSKIPILPDIIAQCGNSTQREANFIDVNEETSSFDVCDSVRPKTCPGSICDSDCFNILDEVQCEKSLDIRHPQYRSCVSACSTKFHHEWGGRKSLLQSLNIPSPIASVSDVLNNHRKASSSGKINSVTTTVPSVENLNIDNRLLRSSFKSRQIAKKDEPNIKKKEMKKKKATTFSSENNNYPETTFTLWNSNPLYSPFTTSKPFSSSSSSSSFSGLLENSSTGDLAESSVKDRLDLDKKRRHRCSECKKKLSITSTFDCRCGLYFCSLHRYSETHNCTYDFKKDSRKILEQANPSVVAPKLPKI